MTALPWLREAAERLLAAVPLLLVVTFGSFLLLYAVGDVAASVAGESASAAQIETVRRNLGLDQPVLLQYWHWLSAAVRGDFGESFRSGRSVNELLSQRMGATVSLATMALALSLLLSVPLAFAGSRWPGSWMDRMTQVGSVIGLSIPNFFLGLILVLLFSVKLGWLPATGYDRLGDGPRGWFLHLLLPAATLGLSLAGEQARTLRASLRQELSADYIRTARAKNVPPGVVLLRHAGRNAGLPLVTVIGLQTGRILAGAVLVEAVFALPGLGSLATDAVFTRDLPIVQAIVLLTAVVVLLASFAVDMTYGLLAPTTRRRA